ncbi:MAG: hypothetical protein ABI378_03565 [Chitinophagaceae bacterium]
MKKLLAIALLFCYLTATSGVTLDYFYCCGKLAKVTVFADNHSLDEKCGKMKDCCKHQKVFKKIQIDQRNAEQASFAFANAFYLPGQQQSFLPAVNASFLDRHAQPILYKRPPPDCFPSRQVSYCVFRV